MKLHYAGTWLLASVAFTAAEYFNLVSGCCCYQGTTRQTLLFIYTCPVFCLVFSFCPKVLIYPVCHGSCQPSLTHSSLIQVDRLTHKHHRCLAAHTVYVQHFIYPLTDLYHVKPHFYIHFCTRATCKYTTPAEYSYELCFLYLSE